MTEHVDFERDLERRIVARASIAAGPFDAMEVARMAIDADVAVRRRRTAWWPGGLPWARPILIAAGLVLAAMLALLAAGALRRPASDDVLAVARRDGLHIAAPGGGDDQVLLPGVSVADPQWSSDGRYVAVLTSLATAPAISRDLAPHELIVLRLDGSVAARYENVITARWRPGADELAAWVVALGDPSSTEVILLQPAIQPPVINPPWIMPLDVGHEVSSMAWDRNGATLSIWTWDRSPSGGPAPGFARWVDRHVRTESWPDVVWGTDSASDGRLAEIVGFCPGARAQPAACPYSLVVAASPTAPGRRLVEGRAGALVAPAWSPDGRSLLFVDDRQHASVVDAGDGIVRRLLPATDPDHGVDWSPDGRHILIVRGAGRDVWLLDTDGSNARMFARDTNGAAWRPKG